MTFFEHYYDILPFSNFEDNLCVDAIINGCWMVVAISIVQLIVTISSYNDIRIYLLSYIMIAKIKKSELIWFKNLKEEYYRMLLSK